MIIIIVHSKKQDNLFIDPEWKGFTVLNILNLVFSFCIFVGVLVLIKDKLKNLKCDTKTSRKKNQIGQYLNQEIVNYLRSPK